MPRHGLAEKHRRLKVDGVDLVEGFLRHLGNGLFALDADAVDEDIEAAMTFGGGIDRFADVQGRPGNNILSSAL
jgi:hypothetical protein